ncbi:MAG: GTP-binding protein [Thermoguttaceae bacterium]
MPATPLILVGGFLGAGKTTLIAAAASHLRTRDCSVGVVTNDQAAGLVDTAALVGQGLPIREVSGGCFCCHFDDLVAALNRLVEHESPDLLIGEPVGSCTDISATVLQPMKQLLADRFQLAPFSVLVDATQLRDALEDGRKRRFPDNVHYVYLKQLEEADLIVLSKIDLVAVEELSQLEELLGSKFPAAAVMPVSARSGQGVDAWLDRVLEASPAGRTITPVDYDVYAEGEAALGWLNATVRLEAAAPANWAGFCRTLIEGMQKRLQALGAEIAHLKLHMAAGDEALAANLTGNRQRPSIRGRIESSVTDVRLLLNARAHVDPARLRSVTEECLEGAAGEGIRLTVEDLRHFAPSRPTPTHRFSSVVALP